MDFSFIIILIDRRSDNEGRRPLVILSFPLRHHHQPSVDLFIIHLIDRRSGWSEEVDGVRKEKERLTPDHQPPDHIFDLRSPSRLLHDQSKIEDETEIWSNLRLGGWWLSGVDPSVHNQVYNRQALMNRTLTRESIMSLTVGKPDERTDEEEKTGGRRP